MTRSVFDRDRQIRSSRLSMGQTFYLVTLNWFVGKNSDAWPSQATLAEQMNATIRTVRNWQTQLQRMRIITVEIGDGRGHTNRYRMNLDALTPKREPNEEPHSAFTDDSSQNGGTTFRMKEEPHSGERRNHVPTERTRKEQKKEQAIPFPPELNNEEFKTAWSEWVIFRREIKKRLTASTVSKQLAELATWGSIKAVQSIEISIRNGWQGLFDPKPRLGETTDGNPEAETAWKTVLESLKLRSRFNLDEIMGDIGERAWRALKSIGLKRIDEANDFDRRVLKGIFIQAFTEQRRAS